MSSILEWTGLSGSGSGFLVSRAGGGSTLASKVEETWTYVGAYVHGVTLGCPVCVLCNEGGVAHSTRVPPREEGEKARRRDGRRGRGGEGGTLCKGRCV